MHYSSNKIQLSHQYFKNILMELLIDLYLYYASSYPLLLVIGAFKRLKRRVKYLWFPKGPGRPPVPENIVDLILDMKRSNLLWGALRISQELRLMGVSLHKKNGQYFKRKWPHYSTNEISTSNMGGIIGRKQSNLGDGFL